MNFTVNATLFAKKLKLVIGAVPAKAAWPIASNVLLRVKDSVLELSATNMEVSLTTSLPVSASVAGDITTPAKLLLDALQQVPEEQAYFVLAKQHLNLASGAFKMRLTTLPAGDFPRIPQPSKTEGVVLSGTQFRNMIARTRYAISDQDKRYFISGALLSATDAVIALVSTDGKRLSMTAVQRQHAGASCELLIPAKTLDLLTSNDSDEDILLVDDNGTMFFITESTTLTSRTMDGTFPNYRRVLPADNNTHIQVPRLATLAMLKRVALASDVAVRGVRMTLNDGTMMLSAQSQTGESAEHVAVDYSGPALKLAFDWTFIADFLSAAAGTSVKLSVKDDVSSTLWSDGAEFLNVIMPMRA